MSARWLGLAVMVAACLWGCPTREFYLQRAEVPWEARGVTRVEVPAFEAPSAAWAGADELRRAVVAALGRGTVEVVEHHERPDAVLKGAITNYVQSSTPTSPRRVLEQSTQIHGDVYVWDLDVTHAIQLTVALRVVGADGSAIWSSEAPGQAHETNTVTLNWPGDDPVPPPAAAPLPPDPGLFDRLRHNALDQATRPLLEALATRYSYRNL